MFGGVGVLHLQAPPPIAQSSIASTCYAVGGVPLAFTQEDFLVAYFFSAAQENVFLCLHNEFLSNVFM